MVGLIDIINDSDVIEIINALKERFPRNEVYHLALIHRLTTTKKLLGRIPLKKDTNNFDINTGEERSA